VTPAEAILDLIQSASGGIACVFFDDGAPRPPKPYITVALQWARAGGSHLAPVDDDGNQLIHGWRAAAVELQGFGPAAYDALDCMSGRLEHPVYVDRAAFLNIAVFKRGPLQNARAPAGDSPDEPNASLELGIRYVTGVTEHVGLIEVVEVEQLADQGVAALPPYVKQTLIIAAPD
jgi:hypothetical protein